MVCMFSIIVSMASDMRLGRERMTLSTPDAPVKRSATCIIVSTKTGCRANTQKIKIKIKTNSLIQHLYSNLALSTTFFLPTCQMPPLSVEVSLVGQTTLHDVAAVVSTRSGRGHAAAVWTISHLHRGPHALLVQLHLEQEKDKCEGLTLG